jgi:hypothetical protein
MDVSTSTLNLSIHFLQLFVRSGDDFGMRVQDEVGNVIHEEEDESADAVPAVIVSLHFAIINHVVVIIGDVFAYHRYL